MRRPLILIIRLIVVAAMVGTVRAILADRKPQRALQGTEPIVGSFDTWPTVPRRPTE